MHYSGRSEAETGESSTQNASSMFIVEGEVLEQRDTRSPTHLFQQSLVCVLSAARSGEQWEEQALNQLSKREARTIKTWMM